MPKLNSALRVVFPSLFLFFSHAGTKALDDNPETREILAGFRSSDPTEKVLAISKGLKSGDRSIRSLAVFYILKDSKSIHIVVSNYSSDAAVADFMSNLPSFDVFNIRWNNNGKDFSGEFASKGREANGSISGESLNIGIGFVEIPAANRRVNVATCSATLTLNAARDALEGPFRCSGVPHRFLASVAL